MEALKSDSTYRIWSSPKHGVATRQQLIASFREGYTYGGRTAAEAAEHYMVTLMVDFPDSQFSVWFNGARKFEKDGA